MIHGILPVWKPLHDTSHDIVALVRRLAKQKKVGHTGTLDPAAEGVLLICLGQATRVAEYVQNMPKAYEGTLTLGIATDTQDREGKVVARQAVEPVPRHQIEAVFQKFTGEIQQVPPMYSAVKVKGRRLYEWAREGQEIDRQERTVKIDHLEIQSVHEKGNPEIDFYVRCSKGTYIRTLCVDIGQALGYPAHMSRLIRVKNGPFNKEHCVTPAQLESVHPSDWQQQWLHPLEAGLTELPSYHIPESKKVHVLNGQRLKHDEHTAGLIPRDTLFKVFAGAQFLALYRSNPSGQEARAVKVFVENR